MKTERETAGDFFYSNFILCLKYLMKKMITERSKGCVPYFYTQVKYKSITVHIKIKTGGDN